MMAEPLTIISGAASIISIYSQCVDAFNALSVQKDLGKEFQICALKLALLQLRLLRWRENIDFSDDELDARRAISDENKQTIESLLVSIKDTFRSADSISRRYAGKDIQDEQDQPDAESIEALTEQVRTLSARKERNTPLLRQSRSKATWFPGDRKKLNRLVESLTEYIDMLVELLPELKEVQRRQALGEASELIDQSSTHDEDVLSAPWLGVAVSSVDQDMGASLKERSSAAESQVPDSGRQQHSKTYARGITHQYGDVGARHQYSTNVGDSRAKVHYGDRYGGRSVFDE